VSYIIVPDKTSGQLIHTVTANVIPTTLIERMNPLQESLTNSMNNLSNINFLSSTITTRLS